MPTQLGFRAALGGLLMGLANLVPGISGGTMLLASGVYTHFVEAIAELSSLRFRVRSIALLAIVVVAAVVAVLLFAGAVKDLVVEHRWVMYSLFIGLTLGGVPVVRRLMHGLDRPAIAGTATGFLLMALLALSQRIGGGESAAQAGIPMFFLAGLAGASAMILPGISGGYLLLLMGVYVPLLAGIDAFKEALVSRDLAALTDPGLQIVLPVGLGVVLGVVGVSNLLRWMLEHRRQSTLGFLLGLLFGSVVGLWPFQRAVEPVVGETIVKGQLLSAEMLAELDHADLPTEIFAPAGPQIAGALAMIALGLLVTAAVARLGGSDERDRSPVAD